MESLLLEEFLEMEVEYVKLFSNVIEGEKTITFIDKALPDMYYHNFVLYNSADGLNAFIIKEISKNETQTKGFFS